MGSLRAVNVEKNNLHMSQKFSMKNGNSYIRQMGIFISESRTFTMIFCLYTES
jgi:hypothetical protein